MTGRNRRDPGARGAIVVVAAALVLGGCATKSDIRELQTEVREELRAQAVRQDSLMMLLTRATASTQDTLRTQGDQLVDFRGDITRLLQSVSKRSWERTSEESLRSEVRESEGGASLWPRVPAGSRPVTTRWLRQEGRRPWPASVVGATQRSCTASPATSTSVAR
jgi:outer membrane murein-binding lipoprotein Lpp